MASSREATLFDVLIGRRIKDARRASGLTQTQLAEAISKTFQQVQKYETGRNRVSAGALFEISIRLQKPIEWFFEDCAKMIDHLKVEEVGYQEPVLHQINQVRRSRSDVRP